MLQLERHQDILKLLGKQKSITVKELCNALYASPATIRRDLSTLEEAGLLRRSHGGAVLNEIFPDQIPVTLRANKNITEKKRIAAKASALVQPGDTIFVDASTTTFYMANYLRTVQDITVITNNPHLSIALAECHIRNYCTGGQMLNDSVACFGSWAERCVRSIRADKFFFSARGICDGVITDSSKNECDIKRAMMECSRHSYFCCGSEKQGKLYPYVIADASAPDEIIDES